MVKVRVSVRGKPSIPNHFLSMPRPSIAATFSGEVQDQAGGEAQGALGRTGRAPPADRGPERGGDRGGGLRDQPGRDGALHGDALLRPRRHRRRRGGGRARGRGGGLRGGRRGDHGRRRRARPHPHAARRQGPAGGRAGRLRDPRRALGLRHHEPDVRRRLLARQGGRARPHHHRLARRALGAGASRQPGGAALLPHARRLGLGHRHHGARDAGARPGGGDPLPRLLRRRRRSRPRRWRSSTPPPGWSSPARRTR